MSYAVHKDGDTIWTVRLGNCKCIGCEGLTHHDDLIIYFCVKTQKTFTKRAVKALRFCSKYSEFALKEEV